MNKSRLSKINGLIIVNRFLAGLKIYNIILIKQLELRFLHVFFVLFYFIYLSQIRGKRELFHIVVVYRYNGSK